MKRNDHYSDTKVRRMFEINNLTLLEAKVSDIALEDIRFCLACETWFAGDLFISTVEHGSRTEFVCEGCANFFEQAADADRTQTLDTCDFRFNFYQKELNALRRDA